MNELLIVFQRVWSDTGKSKVVASFHLLSLLHIIHDAFYALQKGKGDMISCIYNPQAPTMFLPLLPPAPGSGAAMDFLPLNLGVIMQSSLTGHLPFFLYVLHSSFLHAAFLPVSTVIDHNCGLIFLLPSLSTIPSIVALLQVSPFKHFPQMWSNTQKSMYRVAPLGSIDI